ncbi:hypothetical protein AMS68_002188 [Peltaster fructicola]|uniref:Peptidyl-prolyl cis-trans isomerase n=1 Tax=Peltaster fructicola TaxID=286661 RepID=A0A6H0XPU3_9PEZI|nr:hypothetical protein AMS68_002188 [Peltaster fructicola]
MTGIATTATLAGQFLCPAALEDEAGATVFAVGLVVIARLVPAAADVETATFAVLVLNAGETAPVDIVVEASNAAVVETVLLLKAYEASARLLLQNESSISGLLAKCKVVVAHDNCNLVGSEATGTKAAPVTSNAQVQCSNSPENVLLRVAIAARAGIGAARGKLRITHHHNDMAPKGKGKSKDADGDKGGSKTKGAQSINVRHVLCEKHAKKEEALAKLNNGAKFDDVAREFSEDKARQGGALGWKQRGDLLEAFAAVAFELEQSTTSNPKYAEAKTSEGYHIIMVEGRK